MHTPLQSNHILNNYKFVLSCITRPMKNNHDTIDEIRKKSSSAAQMIVRNNEDHRRCKQTGKTSVYIKAARLRKTPKKLLLTTKTSAHLLLIYHTPKRLIVGC